MRTDLLVIWPVAERGSGRAEEPQYPIPNLQSSTRGHRAEVLYKSLEATVADGLRQTWAYADRCGAEETHLVIFDRTPGKAWEEKLFVRRATWQGRDITVWGM